MTVRSCFDGAQHERALSATSFPVRPELVEGERRQHNAQFRPGHDTTDSFSAIERERRYEARTATEEVEAPVEACPHREV